MDYNFHEPQKNTQNSKGLYLLNVLDEDGNISCDLIVEIYVDSDSTIRSKTYTNNMVETIDGDAQRCLELSKKLGLLNF